MENGFQILNKPKKKLLTLKNIKKGETLSFSNEKIKTPII